MLQTFNWTNRGGPVEKQKSDVCFAGSLAVRPPSATLSHTVCHIVFGPGVCVECTDLLYEALERDKWDAPWVVEFKHTA